ncbi:hypothetical protein T11_17840 [Trichinella zimbabwensis]|uniref:Uncharacterized protein n=1 Tax=Trichinella zimbabwensis TaxID=268475 RepID=A0A0V1G6F9_9BILA|nr:hypothetical protein T11_17840 [Trichinella zimbabwensis]
MCFICLTGSQTIIPQQENGKENRQQTKEGVLMLMLMAKQ